MRRSTHTLRSTGRRALRHGARLAPVVAAVTAGLLVVRGIAPASAHAVDLFPIDDWIGDGLKSVGKVVLGPLKLTAGAIAHLLGAIVAALADLLIPKSLVNAGLGAIKWLVELPPLGASPTAPEGVASVHMPHLHELRDTLTWVGLTLLPLQVVLAGGRAFLSPSAYGDAPTEVLQRTIAAAIGLIAFDWLWGALTELVQRITTMLLSLPWVADGVKRMLQSLVIGGASGTAVASEFVVPLILTIAGGVLLALMLLRVGLEVIASIVYVTGGLALGLSVSGAGHRLLQAWMVAAAAVFLLPVLWCVVFVTGAALMVDAGSTGQSGFGDFVGQLYNVGAAIVTFGLAIKLARATLGHAGTAIAGLAATARIGGLGALRAAGGGASGAARVGAHATPQSLARFSQNLRGGMRGAAVGAVRVGAFPLRHPGAAAAYARSPVRATQDAAKHFGASVKQGADDSVAKASQRRGETRTGQDAAPPVGDRQRPRPAGGPPPAAGTRSPRPSDSRQPGARGPAEARPTPPAQTLDRPSRSRSSTSAGTSDTAPPPRQPDAPVPQAGSGSRPWRATRRIAAPGSSSKRKRKRKRT